MTELYCDPVHGNTKTGDGSKENPWGTLESVVNARLLGSKIKSGDSILLLDGHHGSPNIQGQINAAPITIKSVNRHAALMDRFTLSRSARWNVSGLRIGSVGPETLVLLAGEHYLFEDCIVEPVVDATKWTRDQWSMAPKYGILCNVAHHSQIKGNVVRNVKFGMSFNGSYILCDGNTIDYYANDGMNFTCSHSVIQYNRITNHYAGFADNYHYDGIQGFPYYADPEKLIDNVTIHGNTILSSTGEYETIPAVPSGDGADYIQGICVFDGVPRNFTVTNNVIQCTAYHGLSFYGLTDSRIENNTVVLLSKNKVLRGWLGLFVSKAEYGAVVPKNVIIRNNIANTLSIDTRIPVSDLTIDHNVIFSSANAPYHKIPISDPVKTFVKYDPNEGGYDLRLNPNGPAIGAGMPKIVERVVTIREETPTDAGAIPSGF